MEDVKTKIVKIRHHDRVGLDSACLKRVDGWIEQVTQVAKGVTLTRKDMVNWIVNRHAEVLPPSATSELKAQFSMKFGFFSRRLRM